MVNKTGLKIIQSDFDPCHLHALSDHCHLMLILFVHQNIADMSSFSYSDSGILSRLLEFILVCKMSSDKKPLVYLSIHEIVPIDPYDAK